MNGLWALLFWGFVNWNVKVDKPCMFPCSTVLLALGLYNAAVGLGSLVNDDPWDVSVGDQNSTS